MKNVNNILIAVIVISIIVNLALGYQIIQKSSITNIPEINIQDNDNSTLKIELQNAQIKTLQDENAQLQKQVKILSSANKITSNSDDLEKVRDYITTKNIIRQDKNILSDTLDEWDRDRSVNIAKKRRIVSRYESQLNTTKTHINKYIDLLEENKDLFHDLGVAVELEINDLKNDIKLYDEELQGMKDKTKVTTY